MVIKSRNEWGRPGGLEAQRGDLWVLDLEEVLTVVRKASFAGALELPPQQETLHYARSVTFPEARIADIEVRALNTPKLYPGLDESVGGVRVDFMVDADATQYDPRTASVQSAQRFTRSRIYSLLYGWRVLTRIGRLPYNSESFAVPLPATPTPLGTTFKKDVKLYFLKGVTKDFSDIDASASLGNASRALEVSAGYVLKKCWISSIQLNGVDQSTSTPLTLTANLIPEEFYPLDVGTQPTSLQLQPVADFNFRPGLGLV